MLHETPRFCPRCGAALRSEGRTDGRRWCWRCEFVHYGDPKLAVVVLAEDEQGRLLYMQRNHEPQMHTWAWPSGFVDAGEDVRDAARREVREETGIEIELLELLGVWSGGGDPVVLLVWRARPVGGALAAGPEALNAAWRRPADVPPAFPRDPQILSTWRANRVKRAGRSACA